MRWIKLSSQNIKRILLKLSGEALLGDHAFGVDPKVLNYLAEEIQSVMTKQALDIANELNIIGLMNIQFAVKNDGVFIIEVNPRASRTVPFISKAIGNSLAKVASKAMIGKSLTEQNFT